MTEFSGLVLTDRRSKTSLILPLTMPLESLEITSHITLVQGLSSKETFGTRKIELKECKI